MKQETAPGDIVLLEYAMRDIAKMATKIYPEIDKDLLENALETSKSCRQRGFMTHKSP